MGELHTLFFAGLKDFETECWRPPVDIYRCEDGWLIKCDLAGVRSDDIETAVRGKQLRISGVRRDWSIVEGHRVYSMEIVYDRFERVIELPCDLDNAELRIDYRDGMLLVSVIPH